MLDILSETGMVTQEQIDAAKNGSPEPIGVVDRLIEEEVLSEEEVYRTLASYSNMDFYRLGDLNLTRMALDAISGDEVRRFQVLPVSVEDGRLTLATYDPLNFEVMDTLRFSINNVELEFVCMPKSDIKQGITQYYGDVGTIETMMSGRDDLFGGEDEDNVMVAATEGRAEADAPIIQLVSSLLIEAQRRRASDIHLEPLEKRFRIRFRIDGRLLETEDPPKRLQSAIISRLKIMTRTMSIAEKRMPQDGRIQVKIQGKPIDLRVSSIPTNHGESIVMRILDKSGLNLGLPQLGFFSDDQEVFERLITLPDGIVLVTGPTGSGKTTTLYSALNYINKPDKKIITVEDPVEYELGGINQVQVVESVGMTFAAALRAMLRQAPNIIMVGEIRDKETAQIAINASLTGHLVFSTLHTNNATAAIPRLIDMGVAPFLTASSIRACLAQRLVRTICSNCSSPHMLDDKEMRALGIDESAAVQAKAAKGEGCDKCNHTGFRGRKAVFEIFEINDEVRHMINQGISTTQLRARARQLGMRTMREDGIRKVLAGVTTTSEVVAVTMGDDD